MTITLDSVNADLQTTKASVPTLEESLLSFVVDSWPLNGAPVQSLSVAYRTSLIVAPINLSILSLAISWEYWSLAASDTAYWYGNLEVGTGPAGFTTVATRSSQNTGVNANGAITARSPWTFDAAVTTTTPVSVTKGQLLAISWFPSGTVAAMKLPVTYTIRYAAA